ncbi:MAG: hypothetical protein ACI4SM_03460 [Candidatus Gastranaerophilaceae bacterium]
MSMFFTIMIVFVALCYLYRIIDLNNWSKYGILYIDEVKDIYNKGLVKKNEIKSKDLSKLIRKINKSIYKTAKIGGCRICIDKDFYIKNHFFNPVSYNYYYDICSYYQLKGYEVDQNSINQIVIRWDRC